MRLVFKIFLFLFLASSLTYAGNPDRIGAAGAGHLLINPWARSAGWNGLNTANTRGIESMRLNVAGLAFTEKTEVILSHSIYMQGSDMSINTLGFSQKTGASGVIGLSLMTMRLGDIPITSADFPEGGIGTYSPQIINLGLAYAKVFSNSIYGGFTLRVISESIPNANAGGLAVDAGIQYVTGAREHVKFGLALRNIGLPMRYSGNGLNFRGEAPTDPGIVVFQKTLSQPTETFELPSLLNIGFAYDVISDTSNYRLTLAANYTSNAFGKDQTGLGAEFAFREKFMFRVSYKYEKGITSSVNSTSALTGLGGGFTVELPLSVAGSSTIALDYAYRTTNPFKGIHNIGLRVNL